MSGEDAVAELKKRVDELEARVAKIETSRQHPVDRATKPLSVKEFLLEKKPSNEVERALAIGYYLEYLQGYPSFNVRDLADGFRAAKETVPANVSDKVQCNIRKGHMMEVKEKKDKLKAWILTNTGAEHVENGFRRGG